MKSRVEYVYEAIIRKIIGGEYTPGMSITRRETASSLGVSLSPVSEAFALLQSEQIIVTVPRKGTFINKLDLRDLGNLIDVRAALECQAARSYCGETIRSHADQLLPLAELIDESDITSTEHLIADLNFHRSLLRLADNSYLSDLFDRVLTRSMILAMDATISMMPHPEPSMSHKVLIADLGQAEADEAETIIRRNIYSSKAALLNAAASISGLNRSKKFCQENSTLDKILTTIRNVNDDGQEMI